MHRHIYRNKHIHTTFHSVSPIPGGLGQELAAFTEVLSPAVVPLRSSVGAEIGL